MADRRRKDMDWTVADENGQTMSWDQVQVAVLMDIRDELKRLNAILHCGNFLDIPHKLERIKRNTAKRKRPKVQKPSLHVVAR